MNLFAKVALSFLAYNYVKNDIRRPYENGTHVGTRTNMPARGIQNNGGL